MDDNGGCMIMIIATIFISISVGLGWMACDFYHSTKPKPIDVYQGKTTLEITYRDSVAIDSVVVFKKR